MIIDRHNYEECFILYWDDELTLSQKQAVENFVKENADLQEEFKLLGETRFIPDNNIQFEEKEFLLNNTFINITNYEDQLLNYIDDEVTAQQRKEVEKFVSQYPAVQQELALLQKTKLQPESEVTFPDKSILYRREEKVRVISMTWFRVAVAAAIILIAGFVTFNLVNTNKGDEVVSTDPKKSISPVDSPSNQPQHNQQPDNVRLKENTVPIQPTIEKKNQKPVIENRIDNTIASNNPENKNNLPKEGNRTNQTIIVKNTSVDNPIAKIDEPSLPSKNLNEAQKIESDKTDNLLDKSSVTKSTSPTFANISDISDENDRFEKEKDKGGLKEFLRKTTRVFERRTRMQTTTDDNKLLVGAFAVSLK